MEYYLRLKWAVLVERLLHRVLWYEVKKKGDRIMQGMMKAARLHGFEKTHGSKDPTDLIRVDEVPRGLV